MFSVVGSLIFVSRYISLVNLSLGYLSFGLDTAQASRPYDGTGMTSRINAVKSREKNIKIAESI